MSSIVLKKSTHSFKEKIFLPSSKSESNRALIINALCDFKGDLKNLSSARDTQTMIRLLAETDSEEANVIDAGTTMRFLTAYFSVTNQPKTMTGTERMCQRPIGILTDALTTIGVEIEFLGKNGYPPHKINGFSEQKSNRVSIKGNVSSQYISALLMVAPHLPKGLEIKLEGEIGSKPYITMTIELMKSFGVEVVADWENQLLSVLPQNYTPISYQIESDWSGASYWYSIVALAENQDVEIELIGLKENSLQGDSAIVEIMNQLGVKSTFTNDGVLLQKTEAMQELTWDFTNCPDLAQTIAVCCVAKGIKATFTGLESLKIKETDRVLALQNELKKIGGSLIETIPMTEYQLPKVTAHAATDAIETYDDHRMAMAFAPLFQKMDIEILEPNVVVKSYPSFWDDIAKIQ